MKRIVVINIGALGHINPSLSTIQELVNRGYEINYYIPMEFVSVVSKTGANVKSYSSLISEKVPEEGTFREKLPYFCVRLLEEVEYVLPQIIEDIRTFAPDLILYDFLCTTGSVVAKILQKPAITLRGAHVQDISTILKTTNLHLGEAEAAAKKYALLAYKMRVLYKIDSPTMLDILTPVEDFNILFIPEVFQSNREMFDRRFAFVGPGFNLQSQPTSWLPSSIPKEKRLFISLGTVLNVWPDFFDKVIEAFNDSDWEVILSLGQRINPSQLKKTSANIKIASFWPQLQVLPHCAAVVSHGGMGTVLEALSFGVPLLNIPNTPDHETTAQYVVDLKLGLQLDPKSVTAKTILDSINSLVEDVNIARQVSIFANSLQNKIPGYKQAADLIELHGKQMNLKD